MWKWFTGALSGAIEAEKERVRKEFTALPPKVEADRVALNKKLATGEATIEDAKAFATSYNATLIQADNERDATAQSMHYLYHNP